MLAFLLFHREVCCGCPTIEYLSPGSIDVPGSINKPLKPVLKAEQLLKLLTWSMNEEIPPNAHLEYCDSVMRRCITQNTAILEVTGNEKFKENKCHGLKNLQ